VRGGETARFLQCFTLTFRRRRLLFLVVQPTVPMYDTDTGDKMRDPVLGIPVHQMVGQLVCGLPALDLRLHYFIPAPQVGPWLDSSSDDGAEFMLECVWNIDAM